MDVSCLNLAESRVKIVSVCWLLKSKQVAFWINRETSKQMEVKQQNWEIASKKIVTLARIKLWHKLTEKCDLGSKKLWRWLNENCDTSSKNIGMLLERKERNSVQLRSTLLCHVSLISGWWYLAPHLGVQIICTIQMITTEIQIAKTEII